MTVMAVPAAEPDVPAAPAPVGHYIQSGRAAWPIFIGLSAAAVGVAGAMAFVLYLVELAPYVFVVTPALVGAPVFAALMSAVYLGKCRSVALASLLAVALALVYYVGYWEISYRLRAVPNGAQFLAAVEKEGGAPGLVGYFVFRCRIMPDAFEPASAAWTIAFIGLRGLEVGFLIAGGLYAARRLAGRVFYEEYDRWASSNAFLFLPQELPAVLAAVETQEWSRLDAVEKRPPNRFHRRQGGMILRVEFLPRVGDLPVYVTVEGPRLRRAPWLLLVVPALGRLVKRYVEQRRVSAASAQVLARHVGMLDLGEPAAADSAEGGLLGYWSGESRTVGSPHGGLLTSMAREAGVTGATYVGRGTGDFRDRASSASLAAIGSSPDAGVDGVFDSLCYPAEPRPLPTFKRLAYVDIVVCWALLVSAVLGAVLVVLAPPLVFAWDPQKMPLVEVALAVCGSINAAAFLSLFGTRFLLHWLLKRHFRKRPGSLLIRRDDPDVPMPAAHVVRVEDPGTYHVSKLTPEDWGLCVLDSGRRRLLLEGVSHRYVVNGRDVTALVPLVSGASVSVRIEYRVARSGDGGDGGQPFSFVLNRYSNGNILVYTFSTFPILNLVIGPIVRRSSARFATRIGRALGVAVAARGA